ncbi:Bet v1-like protein [Ramicandelaber brevisporus]|nr:Bet v1-like protein [Ramicandelaber brevisporus]
MFKVEDYEFKIVAEFNSIRADILSQVYVDLDYRMIWDPNMVNWEQLDNQCLLFTTKYPFPLQSREYIYSMCRQQVHVDGRVFYVMINLNAAATSPTGSAPPTVRVWEFSQQIAVSATEDGAGSRVVLTYHENPNGPVPNFFYNWAVKAGVPGFIKNLHDACLKYVPPL